MKIKEQSGLELERSIRKFEAWRRSLPQDWQGILSDQIEEFHTGQLPIENNILQWDGKAAVFQL